MKKNNRLARVKAGAAFLDARYGKKWRKKIDLDTLDLSDGDYCVLGQTDGDYLAHVEKLGIDKTKAAYCMGFTEFKKPPEVKEYIPGLKWKKLTAAWKRFLR